MLWNNTHAQTHTHTRSEYENKTDPRCCLLRRQDVFIYCRWSGSSLCHLKPSQRRLIYGLCLGCGGGGRGVGAGQPAIKFKTHNSCTLARAQPAKRKRRRYLTRCDTPPPPPRRPQGGDDLNPPRAPPEKNQTTNPTIRSCVAVNQPSGGGVTGTI